MLWSPCRSHTCACVCAPELGLGQGYSHAHCMRYLGNDHTAFEEQALVYNCIASIAIFGFEESKYRQVRSFNQLRSKRMVLTVNIGCKQ